GREVDLTRCAKLRPDMILSARRQVTISRRRRWHGGPEHFLLPSLRLEDANNFTARSLSAQKGGREHPEDRPARDPPMVTWDCVRLMDMRSEEFHFRWPRHRRPGILDARLGWFEGDRTRSPWQNHPRPIVWTNRSTLSAT